MRRRILWGLSLALILAVVVAVAWYMSGSAQSDARRAAPASGDFGPPQGEPIKAQITDAPNVPPPIKRRTPAKVVVELEVREVTSVTQSPSDLGPIDGPPGLLDPFSGAISATASGVTPGGSVV